MKSNRELLFVAAFVALVFVPGCSTVPNTQPKVATPDNIVRILLDDAKPEKVSHCWKVMESARLQHLSPYLSPQIVCSLQEWMNARQQLSNLGPHQFASYDPLTYRKWQPQKVHVGKAKYSGNTATVVVREALEPGKIRSGHHRTATYIFSIQNGKWTLENIQFISRYIATHGGKNTTLLSSLEETTQQMQKLYISRLKLRMQGKK